MSFAAPALLLGLAAAFLPLLVHLIGRRHAKVVRFAAMELLLAAEREVSARRRLRDALLLVARTALAAALPLVLAKPFREAPSDLPASAGRPQAAVIVLDDSASMRRARKGGTVFDEARAKVRELLSHFAPSSEVALLPVSDGAAALVGELTTDRARVLAALAGARATARTADVGAALARAAQLLEGGAQRERAIYLVGDAQAAGGAPVAPAGTNLERLDVGGGAWSNRAVVGLDVRPAADVSVPSLDVVASVVNHADAPLTQAMVTLSVDGATVATGGIDVPAHGRVQKKFVHAVAGSRASVHTVEVALDGHDDFALDDHRLVVAAPPRGLGVLVVNGDPRTVRNEDETFFVTAALGQGGAGMNVTTAMPEDAAGRTLPAYAAVFLCNVAAPSQALADALLRYVENGGGLFISLGDKVDADAWNRRLGKLLPQSLGLVRTASAAPTGNTTGEVVDTRPAEHFAPLDRTHPLLGPFSAEGSGLLSARVYRYMLLSPVPEAPTRRTVLRFESGAPALVEADVGRGRVLLLATTVDRDWADLAIRPGFLPLIQEAARRLSGAPARERTAPMLVGQAREFKVPEVDTQAEVQPPVGPARLLRRTDPRPGHGLSFHETDEPGLYRVRSAGADGEFAPRPEETFAVVLDPRESDPTPWPPRAAPAAQAGSSGQAPMRRIELWHTLAAALVVLVLVESALTLRRRTPAPADATTAS